MADNTPDDTPTDGKAMLKQLLALLAAAVPMVLAIGLLSLNVKSGELSLFALAWPVFQLGGYAATLKMSKGDFTHHLVASQIMIHWVIMVLLITMARGLT